MARAARVKSPEYIYHVMSRTISEVPLFKDNKDKDKYMEYIKKYKKLYDFKLYSYCLMKNHVHLLIYSNGSDISNIMHGINQSYAQYFNKKYQRHGHLFQDRFKSKVVSDHVYLKTVSLYIHNNPSRIDKYKNCIEKYKYSSLGIFLGKIDDKYDILDDKYLLSLFGKTLNESRKIYSNLVKVDYTSIEREDMEFNKEKSSYKNDSVTKPCKISPEDIMNLLSPYIKDRTGSFLCKYKRDTTEYKAVFVALTRYFCSYTYKETCKLLNDVTSTRIAQLSYKGFQLLEHEEKFQIMYKKFTLK